MSDQTVVVPEGLTEEIVTEVESEVKKMLSDNLDVLMITTQKNVRKGTHEPKFLTVVHVQDRVTGLKATESFSTLRLYRSLKRNARIENV